jgi:hypothetical protein
LDESLFDYFILLAAAGRDRLMPSGGSFFWEEKTCAKNTRYLQRYRDSSVSLAIVAGKFS